MPENERKDLVPRVNLDATSERALDVVELEDLKKFSVEEK